MIVVKSFFPPHMRVYFIQNYAIEHNAAKMSPIISQKLYLFFFFVPEQKLLCPIKRRWKCEQKLSSAKFSLRFELSTVGGDKCI